MKTLVVGAGLAGSATALYLQREGHEVRLIDAESRPHVGGYLLQLDTTAQRFVAELGLRDIVDRLSIATPRVALRAGNREVPGISLSGFRLARRGTFVTAVMERASEKVPVELGVRLTSLEQTATGIRAHFEDAPAEEFDFVVGADGVHSTVRKLAFGGEPSLYKNGIVSVWIDLPVGKRYLSRAIVGWGRNRLIQVFPYPEKTSELAVVSFRVDGHRPSSEHALARSREILDAWGFTSEAELARSVDPAAVRVTTFAQARLPRWHHNRVVLVGDAAHCIDPLSGLGAHGAFHSARHLNDALRSSSSLPAAFDRYERLARPVLQLAQRTTAALVDGLSATRSTHVRSALRDLARAGTAGAEVLVKRYVTGALPRLDA